MPIQVPSGEPGDLIIVWVPGKKFGTTIRYKETWEILKLSEYEKLKMPEWEVREHLEAEKIVEAWLKNGGNFRK